MNQKPLPPQEDTRVKFPLRSLMAVTLLSALFLVACGENQETVQAKTERDQVVSSVSRQVDNLATSLARLEQENSNLQKALTNQETALKDMQFAVRSLQNETAAALTKPEAKASGFRVWQWIIILILFVVVLFVLIRIFKPKPFEEDEDEDFSSFDEDFGFDDEDFGDEAEAEEKKEGGKQD